MTAKLSLLFLTILWVQIAIPRLQETKIIPANLMDTTTKSTVKSRFEKDECGRLGIRMKIADSLTKLNYFQNQTRANIESMLGKPATSERNKDSTTYVEYALLAYSGKNGCNPPYEWEQLEKGLKINYDKNNICYQFATVDY